MAKTKLAAKIISGKKDDDRVMELPGEIFNVTASDKLLAHYVHVYLENQKRHVSTVKTRSEVTGSTRKIYRQKGTGRARHGDIKAPIFVGGGIAHGPEADGAKLAMPKKMRRKSLFYALSLKLKGNKLGILADTLLSKTEKTKEAVAALHKAIGSEMPGRTVVVFPHQSDKKRQLVNVRQLEVTEPHGLNAYNVMKAGQVYFMEKAMEEFINLFKGRTK